MAALRKRLELELPCTLTEEELAFRSSMLAETVNAKDETNAAKRSAMKEFGDKITGLDEKQRELAHILRTGIENRMVACAVEFHTPIEGTKRIVRMDTGEVVKEGAMTAAECQLYMFSSSVEFEEHMRSQTEPPLAAPEPPEKRETPTESEAGDAQ